MSELDRKGRLDSSAELDQESQLITRATNGSTHERARPEGSARLISRVRPRGSNSPAELRLTGRLDSSASGTQPSSAGSRGSTQAAPRLLCRRARPA
ncbi:unnamed protein product [Lampetra planeri]